MTQEQLTEKMGVSINAVSKWERGLSFPDVALYKKLWKELDINIEELINGEKDKSEEAKEKAIKLDFIKIDSLEKAKNVPCIFNNWANFYKGKFVSNTILNANAFEKLIKWLEDWNIMLRLDEKRLIFFFIKFIDFINS